MKDLGYFLLGFLGVISIPFIIIIGIPIAMLLVLIGFIHDFGIDIIHSKLKHSERYEKKWLN